MNKRSEIQSSPTPKTDWCLSLMIKNYHQNSFLQQNFWSYLLCVYIQSSFFFFIFLFCYSKWRGQNNTSGIEPVATQMREPGDTTWIHAQAHFCEELVVDYFIIIIIIFFNFFLIFYYFLVGSFTSFLRKSSLDQSQYPSQNQLN